MKNTVWVLATGGTISGAGAAGQAAIYQDGAFDVQNLLQGLPALKDGLEVRGEQLFSISSDDITAAHWLLLARRIQDLEKRPEICRVRRAAWDKYHGRDGVFPASYAENREAGGADRRHAPSDGAQRRWPYESLSVHPPGGLPGSKGARCAGLLFGRGLQCQNRSESQRVPAPGVWLPGAMAASVSCGMKRCFFSRKLKSLTR